MCAETSNRKTTDKILYLYNSGSYDPIARIDCNTKTNQQQIYYFHSQLNGLPEELTDENGRIVWQGNYQLWGKLNQYKPIYYLNNNNPHRLEQNLRFTGQYADNETGLHYNTFRYYDPESGHFTQQDPIGLMGGINLYQYAPNPLTWIDPLGLSCSSDAQKLAKNLGNKPSDYHQAHHLVMSNSTDIRMQLLRKMMRNFGIDINDARNGIWLPKKAKHRIGKEKTTAHYGEGVHGGDYKEFVWKTLKDSKTRQEFEAGLEIIREALKNHVTFGTKKP